MTREQMIKTNWKPYMKIDYKTERMELPIPCMLLAVDFDTEVFKLCPIDTDFYEAEDVYISVQHIYLPRPTPKLLITKK